MSIPDFNPISTISRIVLDPIGDATLVSSSLALNVYGEDTGFVAGAVEQVSYVYQRLGGGILDVELTNSQVYNAYEEAVLEYSAIVNMHQARNALPSAIGANTATFDNHGEVLLGTSAELKVPRFSFGFAKKVMDFASEESNMGGNVNIYSASFDIVHGQQDYNLQTVVEQLAADSNSEFYDLVGNKKVLIKKVFYKTPRSMWRFFGYYGGLNVVGNMHTYGQFSDDSTYEVVPVWQNKLQAMAYADSIYTRISHYSYDLKNNKLRLYPVPLDNWINKMWFQFLIPVDAFDDDENGKDVGANGVNNMNTLPFANIPYTNINSIGKQWIRRYALAICKEMLGHVRGKFSGAIPIPGSNATLNYGDLLSQAKEEQSSLKEELNRTLEELTYSKLLETSSNMLEESKKLANAPLLLIYKG